MIYYNDSNTHVKRQKLQELDIGIQATSRAPDANDGEIFP